MKIVLLTSTGARHAFVANQLSKTFDLSLVVREEKGFENSFQEHPDREIIEDHFKCLARTEQKFFKDSVWNNLKSETITVSREKLNTAEIANKLTEIKPDAVAVFGCGIIKSPLIETLPIGRTFNLHQGLSPYYRGSGTNFWPFAEGELQYLGMTLHLIDPGVDTGGIIAHERPEIALGDTLHILGCKTVVKSVEILTKVLKHLDNGGEIFPIAQWSDGKLFKRKDLTASAIEKVRELEKNDHASEFLKRQQQGLIPPTQLITFS